MKKKTFFTNDFAAAIKKQKGTNPSEIINDNSLNHSSSYSDQAEQQVAPLYDDSASLEQIILEESIKIEEQLSSSSTLSSSKSQQVVVTHPPSPVTNGPTITGPTKKGNNDLIYQEMQVVKKLLGFDEQDFRQKCHALNIELNKHIKGKPSLSDNFRYN
jgi:hypothetical protein